MSWLQRVLRGGGKGDDLLLVRRRVVRFRQMIRSYQRLLQLVVDAAEKQAGDYVLGRQYILSLAESAQEIAEGMVFDLNVLTEERHLDFYGRLAMLREPLRQLLAGPLPATEHRAAHPGASPPGPDQLAAALAGAEVVFRRAGQVACRGIAAGPVFNLESQRDLYALPEGAVLVASDVTPAEELFRFMSRASAILMDHGKPGGDVASLARRLRIPALLGLEGASRVLTDGMLVTVDADEQTVYRGRVQPLLDYYASSDLTPDEEPEYRLLRQVRRAMFPLHGARELAECTSLHDLVHLAQELAGEALFAVWAPSSPGSLGAHDARPLRALLGALDEAAAGGGGQPGREHFWLLSEDESVEFVDRRPFGFDLVDAVIAGSPELDYLFCRFSPRFQPGDEADTRGAIALGVLTHLNFDAARSPRAVTGILGGRPVAELEERLGMIGHLSRYLDDIDRAGWDLANVEHSVETFMMQFI